jgi:hypothetical protein
VGGRGEAPGPGMDACRSLGGARGRARESMQMRRRSAGAACTAERGLHGEKGGGSPTACGRVRWELRRPAEPQVVFEGERQAQRAGRCAGAARRPPSAGGATADQPAHGRGSAGAYRGTHTTEVQLESSGHAGA